MNRLHLNNDDQDKKIITYTISKEIKEKLIETLKNSERYNLKKKSDWVNEAIESLKNNQSCKELIYNAEGNIQDQVFDKIHMSFQQRCAFSELRNEVVKQYPDIKGPQGAIIRAAILNRLMRKD